MARALTAKQEAFALHLAAGETNIGAYLAAYDYKGDRNLAMQKASRLAKDGRVKARVAELKAPTTNAVQRALNVDLAACLFENARIGFSDVRRLFAEDGSLKAPQDWDDDTAAAVASIKVRELFGEGKDGKGAIGTVTEVKFWDKGAAQDRLLRHFGGYERDNKQKKDDLRDVPREVLRLMEERLDELRRPVVAGLVAGPGAGEPTREG